MASHLATEVNDQDHKQGPDEANITLVEYGDYECSHCGAAYPIIKKIQKEFPTQVQFIFRNFPLSQSHPSALPAAVASEAAALQGKYWEMHDAIYENQRSLSPEGLFAMATTAGLDLEQFKSDIQDDKLLAKVEADFEGGVRSGVNGTPSFFINGTKFDGGAEDLYELLKENAG